MKVLLKLSGFKIIHLIIPFLLFAVIFSLSGCATAPPVFSNITIPLKKVKKDKFKVAIKKEDATFTSGFFSKDVLTGKPVAIYNCIGTEINKEIPDTGVFIVNNKPSDTNIFYIYNFRREVTWTVTTPSGVILPLFFGLIGAAFVTEPIKAVFKANVLINGKNYTIKGSGSSRQGIIGNIDNVHKLLINTCSDFAKQLKTLLIIEKLPQATLMRQHITNTSYKIIIHKIFLHLPPKYKRVYKFSVNNDAKIAGSFKSKNKINLFIFTKHEYKEFLSNSGIYNSIYYSGHVKALIFSKKLNNGKYYLVLYNGNKSRSTTIDITKHIIIYTNNLISTPKVINNY
jgi:uncharacterized protein (UPF0332 family)